MDGKAFAIALQCILLKILFTDMCLQCSPHQFKKGRLASLSPPKRLSAPLLEGPIFLKKFFLLTPSYFIRL
jgi:hypothetical protein